MLLEAYGHLSVFVNGDPRGGNELSYGFVRIPVKLKAGTNCGSCIPELTRLIAQTDVQLPMEASAAS